MEFRKLYANEIELRVGSVYKGGCTLLLYKDSRCDMNILDETVGPENWNRDHKEIKSSVYCGVSIWDDKKSCWVTKWDAGSESNIEPSKGEASDSFKRACVNWGIGRELYTAPKIFAKCDTEQDGRKHKMENPFEFSGSYVSEIEYSNNEIIGLEITGKDGKVIFSFQSNDSTKSVISPVMADRIDKIIRLDRTKEQAVAVAKELYAKFNVSEVRKLTNGQYKPVLDWLEEQKGGVK